MQTPNYSLVLLQKIFFYLFFISEYSSLLYLYWFWPTLHIIKIFVFMYKKKKMCFTKIEVRLQTQDPIVPNTSLLNHTN